MIRRARQFINLVFLGREIGHFVFDHKLRLQVNLINGTNYQNEFYYDY